MKYKYELFLLILFLLVAVIFWSEQSKEPNEALSVSGAQPKEKELTEAQRRFNEESLESFATALKYKEALVIEKAEIRTNSSYQSTYYFTVRNTSDEAIVAFELEGERYRVNIKPNKTYSGKMRAKTDMVSLYKINSIVLANGELINILGESTTRFH